MYYDGSVFSCHLQLFRIQFGTFVILWETRREILILKTLASFVTQRKGHALVLLVLGVAIVSYEAILSTELMFDRRAINPFSQMFCQCILSGCNFDASFKIIL